MTDIPHGEHGNYHYKYNVLDLETLRTDREVGGWSIPSLRKMGISVGVMRSFDGPGKPIERKTYADIHEEDVETLNILPRPLPTSQLFFDLAAISTEKKFLIGHNIIGFDMEVMTGHFDYLRLLNPNAATQIPSPLIYTMNIVDTMHGFGHRVKLHQLAMETVGIGKSGSGALAPDMWKQERYDDVIEYCDRDTEITRLVYEYYLQNGYVILDGRRRDPGWRK